MNAVKIFENRMRRAVARQGFRLMKSRRRDPGAPDFGRYVIAHANRNHIIYPPDGVFALTLEDVESWSMARATLRRELPRVFELGDLIERPSKPSAYFQNWDNPLFVDEPDRKRAWLAREREFQQLDAPSWQCLKEEARPYLTARDAKGRGWQQLITILNQARAHNYLVDLGCSQVCFIPRAKVEGQKTPDLEGDLNGQKVLCEVKTINPSQDEMDKRLSGRAGLTTNVLDEGFFKKFNSSVLEAKDQMRTYDDQDDVRRIVFFVITFDEPHGEYKIDYFAQIDRYLASDLASDLVSDLDIVFYNQRTAFHQHVSMLQAHVVNEPS
jgi:hypothetical protein